MRFYLLIFVLIFIFSFSLVLASSHSGGTGSSTGSTGGSTSGSTGGSTGGTTGGTTGDASGGTTGGTGDTTSGGTGTDTGTGVDTGTGTGTGTGEGTSGQDDGGGGGDTPASQFREDVGAIVDEIKRKRIIKRKKKPPFRYIPGFEDLVVHPHIFQPENILGRRWLRIQTAPEQYILKGNLLGSNVVAYVDLLTGDVRLVTKVGKRFNWLTDFYSSAGGSQQLTDVFDFHPDNNLAFQIERGPDDINLNLLFYGPEVIFGDLNGEHFFITSDGSISPLNVVQAPKVFRGLNLPLQKLLDLLERIGEKVVAETKAASKFSLSDAANQIISYRQKQKDFGDLDNALAGINWKEIDVDKLTDEEVNKFTELFSEFDEAQLEAAAARSNLPGLFPFWARGEWQSLEGEDLIDRLFSEAAISLKSFTAYFDGQKITCQLLEKVVDKINQPDCRRIPLAPTAEAKISEGIEAYSRVLNDYTNFANLLEEQVFMEVLTDN